MSQIKLRPIQWFAKHLHCDCGEEMMFLFEVRKPVGIVYLHTCTKCGAATEEAVKYPVPIWEAAKNSS